MAPPHKALWVTTRDRSPIDARNDTHKPWPAVATDMIRNLAATQTGFTSNVFLVDGEHRVLVDVGSGFDVVAAVRDATDGLDAVVLTHTHPDHVGNLDAVVEAFGVRVCGWDGDNAAIDDPIDDGDRMRLGDHEYVARYTPGHAPDHLCFYAPEPSVLFAGDLVFANGGFGRTDLAGGDRRRLVESIERVLSTVDDDLSALHAGHGPSVTDGARHDIELALNAARAGV